MNRSPGNRDYKFIIYTWLVPGAILLLAVLLRILGLNKSLWIDEAGSYFQATANDFIGTARNYNHPPLYYGILRLETYFTHSYAVLRLFSVACGTAAVALYLRTKPSLAGWLSGLLVACSPELVYNSQELRQYALLNLLFALALISVIRILEVPGDRNAKLGLGIWLAIAAATHLVTGFFVGACALVLAWSQRQAPPKRLAATLTVFVPAVLLLWFFNRVFLTQTGVQNANNWWMGPVTLPQIVDTLCSVSGWNAVHWVAAALGRHVRGGELPVLGAAAVGLGFAMWTAWAHRGADLARTFLVISLLYWSLLIVYSIWAVNLILPRIMLPGALSLFLSLGIGIALHPQAWRRRMASIVIIIFALTATLPWLWYAAWHPREDLLGLTQTVRQNRRPGDVLVFVGGTELALYAYWPDYTKSTNPIIKIDIFASLPDQLEQVRQTLMQESQRGDVLLIYRVDGYLRKRLWVLDEILRFFAATGMNQTTIWEKDYYYVLRFHTETRASSPVNLNSKEPPARYPSLCAHRGPGAVEYAQITAVEICRQTFSFTCHKEFRQSLTSARLGDAMKRLAPAVGSETSLSATTFVELAAKHALSPTSYEFSLSVADRRIRHRPPMVQSFVH